MKRPKWLKIFTVIFAVASAASFAMFIYEEALQTVMFATWQAEKDQRELHAQVYESLLIQAEVLTNMIGWLNPLAYISFKAYWQSARVWMLSAYPSKRGGTP